MFELEQYTRKGASDGGNLKNLPHDWPSGFTPNDRCYQLKGFIAIERKELRLMVTQRNGSNPEPNRKNHPLKNQALTRSPEHAFRWSQTRAWCTCGRWTRWKCSRSSGLRNHRLHMMGVADRAVGHDGALQDRATMDTTVPTHVPPQ